jgi:hypothetical protein
MTRQITVEEWYIIATDEGHILTVKDVEGKLTVTSARLKSHKFTLTIPEGMGIESIGEHAFDGCKRLTAITLPEGLRNIGGWAFCECIKLTDIILPVGLQSIGCLLVVIT